MGFIAFVIFFFWYFHHRGEMLNTFPTRGAFDRNMYVKLEIRCGEKLVYWRYARAYESKDNAHHIEIIDRASERRGAGIDRWGVIHEEIVDFAPLRRAIDDMPQGSRAIVIPSQKILQTRGAAYFDFYDSSQKELYLTLPIEKEVLVKETAMVSKSHGGRRLSDDYRNEPIIEGVVAA